MADTKKVQARIKRAKRVRSSVKGTADRPRLSVFRSSRNIFAQLIDDTNGATVAAASSLEKENRRKPGTPFDKELAREIGKRLAVRAKDKHIEKVVFDRGPYLYHGKIKALADGAREGGLEF